MSIKLNIDTEGSWHRKQIIHKFNNGFSVSVAWGTGLYCSDRYDKYDPTGINGNNFNKSEGVEVAIFDKNDEIVYNLKTDGLDHYDVFGWCDTGRVAEILWKVSQLPANFDKYTLSPCIGGSYDEEEEEEETM